VRIGFRFVFVELFVSFGPSCLLVQGFLHRELGQSARRGVMGLGRRCD